MKEDIDYHCPICHDTGLTFFFDEDGNEFAKQCSCVKVKSALRRFRKSGAAKRFKEKTFDNFITGDDRHLIQAKNGCADYAEKASKGYEGSLMLCGYSGLGKTHLGFAVCNVLIDNGIAVEYMSYRDTITKLRQNIYKEEQYSAQMNILKNAGFLFIDDLFKGKVDDTDIGIVYELINHRYLNDLPVIVSTEIFEGNLADYDSAIASRLIEMCGNYIYDFTERSKNYRTKGITMLKLGENGPVLEKDGVKV